MFSGPRKIFECGSTIYPEGQRGSCMWLSLRLQSGSVLREEEKNRHVDTDIFEMLGGVYK
jgi:hypothetical protein